MNDEFEMDIKICDDVFKLYVCDRVCDGIAMYKDGQRGYVVSGETIDLPDSVVEAMLTKYGMYIDEQIAESIEAQHERAYDEMKYGNI